VLVGRLDVDRDTPEAAAVDGVRAWIEAAIPTAWVEAGRAGGAAAVREVRTRRAYEEWYPTFAASGLVVTSRRPSLARSKSNCGRSISAG
jgi:hypothetical protein